MKFKPTNPLNYPLAVLAGGIVMIIGGRFAQIPPALMIPIGVILATGGAVVLRSREPERLNLGDAVLEQEILQVKQSALALTSRAEALRQEAARILIEPNQMDLLIAVQFACDRTVELPSRIDEIGRRMGGNQALLSVTDLERQLQQVMEKRRNLTSEAGRAQLYKVEESLRQNLEIAKEGQDSRQIQVANLIQWVTESGGILQQMQNKMRSMSSISEMNELQELSTQLNTYQESVDLLIS